MSKKCKESPNDKELLKQFTQSSHVKYYFSTVFSMAKALHVRVTNKQLKDVNLVKIC